ncbi:MAG: hypothetical protein AB8G15_08895 [Saprospiraceae bacterium]
MKKSSIFFALCFCLSLLTTSCTKTCHGGGWYGNRNLSSIEMKKPTKKTTVKKATTITAKEDLEATTYGK